MVEVNISGSEIEYNGKHFKIVLGGDDYKVRRFYINGVELEHVTRFTIEEEHRGIRKVSIEFYEM